MMKKYTFLLLLVLMMSAMSTSAQSPFGYDRAQYGLRGQVRVMTQSGHNKQRTVVGVEEGKMKLLSPQNYTVNFNLQGRVIEATDVDMLGGNTQRTLFHTARGKRKPNSSTAYLYNQKEELLGTFETKLTEDGRLISEKWFIGAVPLTQKFYYYNPDSTLARYRESFLPRFGGNKYEVEYSSINGKPQIIAHYKQMGRLKQRYVYDYNADGQVEYVYSYNSRGDQVSVSHYTYNEQGDMTMAQSDKRFHRGMELLTELFDYHGMPAGVIEKSGTYLFDYQYDEAGNWVKCAVNYDGQPQIFISRELSYF